MAKLSVNVNKIATLRNTRPLDMPSVVRCAEICLRAGAAGITVHPRPDARHIRPDDVLTLADLLRQHPGTEFNVEGNPFEPAWMQHIRLVRPAQCTLVPDAPGQSTSDHGWTLATSETRLRPLIAEMKSLGCRVSLFIDHDSTEWDLARDLGADRVELYTEPYARRFAAGDHAFVEHYARAAEQAHRAGLQVNAGHDLNLHNLPGFVRSVRGVAEVSIGHALIADALEFGLTETVRRYIFAAEGQPQ